MQIECNSMDEYIRKHDAVNMFNRAVQDVGILDADDIEIVFGMLSPADVVPVVRCRDCKHWKSYWGRCYKHDEYGMASDDFCSCGEKREE